MIKKTGKEDRKKRGKEIVKGKGEGKWVEKEGELQKEKGGKGTEREE